MNISTKLLKAAAGQAGGAGLDVDEVFSTHLWTGTGSAFSVNNGIDCSGEGALVWIKNRGPNAANHALYDTARGVRKFLYSNATNAEDTASSGSGLTAFNSNGFNIGTGWVDENNNGQDVVSWTFRKAPKFFDIVTYTGDDSGNVVKSHSLGSTPGIIIIKNLSSNTGWDVFHRSTTNGLGTGRLFLHDTGAEDNTSTQFLTADSSSITLTHTIVKTGGENYVAYLFAHNDGDGGFGPDADQDIIKCGSYTGNGSSTGPVINLGFEPQWIIVKGSSQSGNWTIIDNMRGLVKGANAELMANLTNSEGSVDYFDPQATGFQLTQATYYPNSDGETYIYMAIRRGPLAAPEDATKVFAVDTKGSSAPYFDSNHIVDMALVKSAGASGDWYNYARLIGENYLATNTTAAKASASEAGFDFMNGHIDSDWGGTDAHSWMWKRARGYFDVVVYEGPSTTGNISHNLGVVPEMIWVKNTDATENWAVYHKDLGNTYYLHLNTTAAASNTDGGNFWNSTTPTASVFSVGTSTLTSHYTRTHVAYLFATVSGVSKVGSYTGNATSDRVIDCGFSNGARFVLIKDADTNGTNWQVFDTTRGLTSTKAELLRLNLTNAQIPNGSPTQDYHNLIEPDSSGFKLNNTSALQVNASGVNYIFYAIA